MKKKAVQWSNTQIINWKEKANGWLFLQVSIWYINPNNCLYPLSKKSLIWCIHVYVAFPLFLCSAWLCNVSAWWSCYYNAQWHKLFFWSPENGIIKSDKVYEVMLATDRSHYSRCNPYMDSPQSIGMIIKPIMHRSTVSGVIIQPNVCFSFNLKAIKQPSALHTWYEIFHSFKHLFSKACFYSVI